MRIHSLKEASLKKGTKVIVRADFDVPIKNGKIVEPFRVQAVLPTLKFLKQKGAQLRLISHLGRPQGKKVQTLSLSPVAKYLARQLKCKVIFLTDPLTQASLQKYNNTSDIILFENVRFWPGEEKNDRILAQNLARWGEIYINEAFANSHRNHASIVALPKLLPSFAGLQLEKELKQLKCVSDHPRHPFVAILGGIKLETKLPLVRKFLQEADRVLIGGAIANSLFHARGQETGKSRVESFTEKGVLENKKLFLPIDLVTSLSIGRKAPSHITSPGKVLSPEYIVDIGPKTIVQFSSLLKGARTVVWNGPLGHTPYFPEGTIGFARALAKNRGFKVIGGGDTITALESADLLKKGFTHVSTGGGAMLEFMAGKKLPGLAVLEK